MERGELGRSQRSRLRHEMFSEQIFPFDQRSFERQEEHAPFEERFRQRIAPEQLIVRKEEPSGGRLKPSRPLEDFVTLGLGQLRWLGVTGKVELIDAGKSPGLILSIWEGKRFEFRPGRPLLVLEPTGKIGVAHWRRAGHNRRSGMFLRRFAFHYFIENSCLVSHARKLDANGGPETAVACPCLWGRNPSRPSLPSQARSGA